MITVFRRIREKLIASGSVTKYLLYATGEILLVVVGILIALQVNNWNEERANDKKAHDLAKALIVEFQTNQEQLEQLFEIHRDTDRASKKLLNMRNESHSEVEDDSLLDLLWPTYMMWTFDPVNGALRSGISSGDINLLESDSLKAKLFQWEDLVSDLDEEETRMINYEIVGREIKNEYVPTLHILHLRSGIPASMFKPEFEALLNSRAFETYLTDKIFEIGSMRIEMRVLQEEASSIIELLKKELKRGY